MLGLLLFAALLVTAVYLRPQPVKLALRICAEAASRVVSLAHSPLRRLWQDYAYWLQKEPLPPPRVVLFGLGTAAFTCAAVFVEYWLLLSVIRWFLPGVTQHMAILLVLASALGGSLVHFGSRRVCFIAIVLIGSVLFIQGHLAAIRDLALQQIEWVRRHGGDPLAPPFRADHLRLATVCCMNLVVPLAEAAGFYSVFRWAGVFLGRLFGGALGFPLWAATGITAVLQGLFAENALPRLTDGLVDCLLLLPVAVIRVVSPRGGVLAQFLAGWLALLLRGLWRLVRSEAQTINVEAHADVEVARMENDVRVKTIRSEAELEARRLQWRLDEQERDLQHVSQLAEGQRKTEAKTSNSLFATVQKTVEEAHVEAAKEIAPAVKRMVAERLGDGRVANQIANILAWPWCGISGILEMLWERRFGRLRRMSGGDGNSGAEQGSSAPFVGRDVG